MQKCGVAAMIVRDFYVSMRRGERTAYLAGPFTTHAEALALVPAAEREAIAIDPWAHFDAFGTCSLPVAANNPVGKLNDIIGISANIRK